MAGAARTRRRRRWISPAAMLVGVKSPGVEAMQTPAQALHAFVPDGYIFPRANDIQFDITVRVPSLAANDTTTVEAYKQSPQLKGGWIRKIGYAFNNPHGHLHVKTFLLIDGAAPSNYMFRTVDSVTGAFEGSFPPVQIGSIQSPADVYIRLPQSAKVEIRFENANLEQAFSCAVRLWGWSQTP